MTEQRKQRLRAKIQESRARLMDSQPFMALLLMYLRYVAVPDMKKISTNGRCIFFSPDYLDKLYWHELDFILCHQLMHIVCEDIWRPYDLTGDNYHFACDIVVNSLLEGQGFADKRLPHLGDIFREVPAERLRGKDHSVDEIFSALPFSLYLFDERLRSKFLPDNDSKWDDKEDTGKTGIIILDAPDEAGILQEGEEISKEKEGKPTTGENGDPFSQQVWLGRIAATKDAIEKGSLMLSAGSIPEFIERMLGKAEKPTVDWRKVLNEFVQERVCDYSFSPPDRRYSDTGFFLPNFNATEFVSKEILFMVDTSGSVSDDDLAAVYVELQSAIAQFDGKLEGKLGFFDADVKEPMPFSNVTDLRHIKPKGGGGTDFCPIFTYVRDNYRNEFPACIVIFTDGFAPYPEESDTLGIPVLWLINNEDMTPPFGKVARILSGTTRNFE